MSATHLCLGADACVECADRIVELSIELPKRMADVSLCCKVADAVVMAKGVRLLGTPTIDPNVPLVDESRTIVARAIVTDPRMGDSDLVLDAVTARLPGLLAASAAFVVESDGADRCPGCGERARFTGGHQADPSEGGPRRYAECEECGYRVDDNARCDL